MEGGRRIAAAALALGHLVGAAALARLCGAPPRSPWVGCEPPAGASAVPARLCGAPPRSPRGGCEPPAVAPIACRWMRYQDGLLPNSVKEYKVIFCLLRAGLVLGLSNGRGARQSAVDSRGAADSLGGRDAGEGMGDELADSAKILIG